MTRYYLLTREMDDVKLYNNPLLPSADCFWQLQATYVYL